MLAAGSEIGQGKVLFLEPDSYAPPKQQLSNTRVVCRITLSLTDGIVMLGSLAEPWLAARFAKAGGEGWNRSFLVLDISSSVGYDRPPVIETKKRLGCLSSGSWKAFATAASLLVAGQVARAVVAGDEIYVADVNTGAIVKINSAGQVSAFGNVGLVNPVYMAVGSGGNLYVANREGGVTGTIDQFDPAGHLSLFTSALDFPGGVAFDKQGNLYCAMVGNNTIEKFNSAGQGTLFASGLDGPLPLAFDAAGNLYACNQNDSTIIKFNSAGQGTFFANSGQYGDGLAFDRNGNLFVANFGDNTIQEITPNGVSSIFANVNSGVNAPINLAFDEAGNLFVLNAGNNSIEEFDPSGHGTLFANTGLGHVQAMAIEVVPEPSSWATLGLGLGLFFLCGISPPSRRRPFRPA